MVRKLFFFLRIRFSASRAYVPQTVGMSHNRGKLNIRVFNRKKKSSSLKRSIKIF